MKTKIILREDIASLGYTGEVVEVAAGFARNHLLPRGLAWPHNEDFLRRIEKDRVAAEGRRAAEMKEFQGVADRISGLQLTFEEKVSNSGHLYGSVSAQRIAEGLAEHGVKVSERDVRLEDPLKEVGEFEVPIHLHADLDAKLKVWVVAAAAAPAPPAAETGDSDEA